MRFYGLPKDNNMAKKWKTRLFRNKDNAGPSIRICSDHFEDEDFQFSQLLQADILDDSALFRHRLPLKKDAIPNTDRSTGEVRIGNPVAKRVLMLENGVISEPEPGKRKRGRQAYISSEPEPGKRKYCRRADISSINDMIVENLMEIVGDSSSSLSVAGPSEASATVDTMTVEEDILPPKGLHQSVQCTPSFKSIGTQVDPKSFPTITPEDHASDSDYSDSVSSENETESDDDLDYLPPSV